MSDSLPDAAVVPLRRRRRILIGSALAVLVVAALLLALLPRIGNGFSKLGGSAQDKPAVPLEFVRSEVVRPAMVRMPVGVEFSGPLVAPRTAIVRAKAAGTLLSLAVHEGSRVRAGQVIGEIDLAEMQSKVADRSALVEAAQAGHVEAERQHAANISLAAQNFISPTALQTSQARLDAARSQLKSAQAQLVTSRLGMREARLAVPIAGIVGKRHVLPGEKVSAEQPVVTVVDLSTLELAGTVGTHEVSLLQAGQAATVHVEGQTASVAGRIDRIAPAAEAGTRAIGVVVVLENRGERFRAGQYAQARVELADALERLTVPAAAVGQASGQEYVWTLEKGVLVRRIIVTGRRDAANGRTEVRSGLAPDALVLAVRFDNLKEGALAKVVTERGTGASAPSGAAAASAAAVPRS